MKKVKLYSNAHLEAARVLFPDRIENEEWLNNQWTTEEINACKNLESHEFIVNPTLGNWIGFNSSEHQSFLDQWLSSNSEAVNNFLSIGCGWGSIEIGLAMKHPTVNFLCVDNAPNTEMLNNVVSDLSLSNIKFRNGDLRNDYFGEYDVVYSHAVIYCIPDEGLANFFSLLGSSLNDHGTIFVSSAANISLLAKMTGSVKQMLGRSNIRRGLKMTGWMRDAHYVMQYVPSNLKICKCIPFSHYACVPLGSKSRLWRGLIGGFSKYIHPISNNSFMLIMEHSNVESKN